MIRLFVFGTLAVSLLAIPPMNSVNEAAVVAQEPVPMKMVTVGEPNPYLTAKAYGVFDIETGELLLGSNVDQELPIASVAKLFTAAAVLRADTEETVVVSASDIATEGRAGKLAVGDVYTARELLFPLLLESSNDAAVALGRVVGKVSMDDKELPDPAGLSAGDRASVSELGTEVRHLYLTMPHIFDITRLSQYVGKKTGWVNNSPVRELPGYLGGKHGYTEAAGRTLVALFTEPRLNNRALAYVILGSDNPRTDTESLRTIVDNSVAFE